MADVTLKYKGATIGELSESGNKTIETAGKYCEADILLEYIKSASGGGYAKKSGSFVLDTDYKYALAVTANYSGSILVDTGLKNIYAIFLYSEEWLNKTATSSCWGACGFINNGISCLAGAKNYPYHYGIGLDLGYLNGNYYQQDSVGGVILNTMNSGIPAGKFGMRVRNDTYPIRAGHTIRWEAIGEE